MKAKQAKALREIIYIASIQDTGFAPFFYRLSTTPLSCTLSDDDFDQ
jgi:hypothetical protein